MLTRLRKLFRFLMESGGPYYTGVTTNPYDNTIQYEQDLNKTC
jgi:hypothetical protein